MEGADAGLVGEGVPARHRQREDRVRRVRRGAILLAAGQQVRERGLARDGFHLEKITIAFLLLFFTGVHALWQN